MCRVCQPFSTAGTKKVFNGTKKVCSLAKKVCCVTKNIQKGNATKLQNTIFVFFDYLLPFHFF